MQRITLDNKKSASTHMRNCPVFKLITPGYNILSHCCYFSACWTEWYLYEAQNEFLWMAGWLFASTCEYTPTFSIRDAPLQSLRSWKLIINYVYFEGNVCSKAVRCIVMACMYIKKAIHVYWRPTKPFVILIFLSLLEYIKWLCIFFIIKPIFF